MKLNDTVSGLATMSTSTTTPPPLFTDGDLIGVMKNIADYTQIGKSERADLAGGIGTSRTREAIIAAQFSRGFVEFKQAKKKKVIHATEKGLMIYEAALTSTPELCSPKLTAEFDAMLSRVADGSLNFAEFIDRQGKFTTHCINNIKENNPQATYAPRAEVKPIDGHGEECGKCKKGTMQTKYSAKSEKSFLSCNNVKKVGDKWVGCDNVKFPESAGWKSKK